MATAASGTAVTFMQGAICEKIRGESEPQWACVDYRPYWAPSCSCYTSIYEIIMDSYETNLSTAFARK